MLASLLIAAEHSTVWKFDNLAKIGGYPVTLLGHPRVIDTDKGKAVQFNGVNDAMFLDVHPLAGARAFTWEVIFHPDLGGQPEQRFFHLQENGTDTRMLFEIRVIGEKWFLDSFALSGKESKALFNQDHLHPLGKWYHVAAVYDGKVYRNYVDGIEENKAELHLDPQGPGKTSVGVRINRVDYFKGAVRIARMTDQALTPDRFLKH